MTRHERAPAAGNGRGPGTSSGGGLNSSQGSASRARQQGGSWPVQESDDATQLIATIRKNALEEVRVSLSEFRGATYLDVRTFADFDGTSEERRATKKGVTLRIEAIAELIRGLQRAQEEACRRGLLEEGAS